MTHSRIAPEDLSDDRVTSTISPHGTAGHQPIARL